MDDDRLTTLYRKYGPVIYGRCRRLLNDHGEAEDATHETFMRLRGHLDRLADPGEAVYFIYRVATNYCLSQLRSRRRRAEPVSELPERWDPATLLDPECPLVERDLVHRLLDRAPERLRSTVWLYHVDGFDQEEVARILGISRHTVMERLKTFATNARKFIRRNGV